MAPVLGGSSAALQLRVIEEGCQVECVEASSGSLNEGSPCQTATGCTQGSCVPPMCNATESYCEVLSMDSNSTCPPWYLRLRDTSMGFSPGWRPTFGHEVTASWPRHQARCIPPGGNTDEFGVHNQKILLLSRYCSGYAAMAEGALTPTRTL